MLPEVRPSPPLPRLCWVPGSAGERMSGAFSLSPRLRPPPYSLMSPSLVGASLLASPHGFQVSTIRRAAAGMRDRRAQGDTAARPHACPRVGLAGLAGRAARSRRSPLRQMDPASTPAGRGCRPAGRGGRAGVRTRGFDASRAVLAGRHRASCGRAGRARRRAGCCVAVAAGCEAGWCLRGGSGQTEGECTRRPGPAVAEPVVFTTDTDTAQIAPMNTNRNNIRRIL